MKRWMVGAIVGAALVVPSATNASLVLVTPSSGTYAGSTHGEQARHIRFTYEAPKVKHFTVGGHLGFHHGHVHGLTMETTHEGVTYRIDWVSDHGVEGTITSHGHTTHFDAHEFAF